MKVCKKQQKQRTTKGGCLEQAIMVIRKMAARHITPLDKFNEIELASAHDEGK